MQTGQIAKIQIVFAQGFATGARDFLFGYLMVFKKSNGIMVNAESLAGD